MSLVDDLLAQAEMLATIDKRGRPRQVNLRRSISAAYYAVFHAVAERALREVLGVGQASSPMGQRLRRTISHQAVLKAAKWFEGKPKNIPQVLLPLRGSITAPPPIDPRFQSACEAIRELQEERHLADYDATVPYSRDEAVLNVNKAVSVVEHLRIAKGEDVRLFLFGCVFTDLQKNS